MSARKQEKSGVVVRSVVESKRGAALLVERVQLTPSGALALTTTAKSISGGARRGSDPAPLAPDLRPAV